MDYFRAKRYLDALPDWEVGRPALGPIADYLPRMRALLTRLGDPQTRFRSVIVGGTNGKGTVASLLAAILKAQGHKAGLYTSPHLHTQRERIRIDGEILSKEQWADAVSHLDDCTRDFGREALGSFSKFEALTGLAAYLFAQQDVEFGVFEVGLGGRYDATNAWDSELAVLTAIGLDHVDLLGNTLEEIAADKLHIARPGRALVTTAAQPPEVMDLIRQTCAKREVELQVAGTEWHLGYLTGHPATYAENARLALEAAQGLVQGIEDEVAHQVVATHHWPGRFEVAQEKPLVLLDGGAQSSGGRGVGRGVAAAERRASRRQYWRRMGTGRRRGDRTRCLGDFARPSAGGAAGLADFVGPSTGADTSGAGGLGTGRTSRRAGACKQPSAQARTGASGTQRPSLRSRVPALGGAGAGVFRPARRARRHHRRHGAGESGMCRRGGPATGTHLRVDFGRRHSAQAVGRTAALALLAQQASLQRLRRGPARRRQGIPIRGFRRRRVAHPRYAQALQPAGRRALRPLQDPRHSRGNRRGGSGTVRVPPIGQEVPQLAGAGRVLGAQRGRPQQRLESLFANSAFLDNVALVQQYVAGPEYRIVASHDELLLAYRKESEAVGADGDLNPLHQATGRAVRVEDATLLAQMQQLTEQVAGVFSLGFYAIDLIHGADGFSIIEINPNPMCYVYNRDNGRRDFIRLYERLLTQFAL